MLSAAAAHSHPLALSLLPPRKHAAASAGAAAAAGPYWRDLGPSEHTARDHFLMASSWMRARLQLGVPAEHALQRQMVKLQGCAAADGARRLVVSSSVSLQQMHTEARTLAAPLSYRLNVLAHKHEASFCNGPHIDHAVSGFQLPVRNIHVQFLATPAVASSLPVLCHATPVSSETIVVCIDNPKAGEWARTQRAGNLSLSTADGFSQATAMVRHNLAASVVAARKADADRRHVLLRLVTDANIHTDADWERVASLFSLAEFMLIAHRDQVEQPLSKLLVVPVSSDNYASCVMLSVALTLLSDTYFTTGWVGGRGPPVKRTAGDVMAVVGGFWRAMAEHGGVAHQACFDIAAFEKPINLNMQSMSNRNHSNFKLFGSSKIRREERDCGDHACFCAYDAARVARFAALWPGAPVFPCEIVDLTADDDDDEKRECEGGELSPLPSSSLASFASPSLAAAVPLSPASSVFGDLPDLPLFSLSPSSSSSFSLASPAPFALVGAGEEEEEEASEPGFAFSSSLFSFMEEPPQQQPPELLPFFLLPSPSPPSPFSFLESDAVDDEPPAKRARMVRALLASVEETKRQAEELGLQLSIEMGDF